MMPTSHRVLKGQTDSIYLLTFFDTPTSLVNAIFGSRKKSCEPKIMVKQIDSKKWGENCVSEGLFIVPIKE